MCLTALKRPIKTKKPIISYTFRLPITISDAKNTIFVSYFHNKFWKLNKTETTPMITRNKVIMKNKQVKTGFHGFLKIKDVISYVYKKCYASDKIIIVKNIIPKNSYIIFGTENQIN